NDQLTGILSNHLDLMEHMQAAPPNHLQNCCVNSKNGMSFPLLFNYPLTMPFE
ncbi:hypothetical protein J6590_064027, partial [Homalodisca vitripennis]